MGTGTTRDSKRDVERGNSRPLPSPDVLRIACYDILKAVRSEGDGHVRRILAGLAFGLAQDAEVESRRSGTTGPSPT